MEEIKTREELKKTTNLGRCIILFSKPDCIHCTIAKNCIESIEHKYPQIGFYYTEKTDFASARNINSFPVLIFYENGAEKGRLLGSSQIHKIRGIVNLWITE